MVVGVIHDFEAHWTQDSRLKIEERAAHRQIGGKGETWMAASFVMPGHLTGTQCEPKHEQRTTVLSANDQPISEESYDMEKHSPLH